jgi:Ni/Co efflux regulator RcnB
MELENMSGTRKIILGAMTALSFMVSAPAFADKGGNGHGRWSQESDNSYIKNSYGQNDDRRGNDDDNYDRNENRTKIVKIYDNDRSTLRRYAEDHYKKFCPPGLAKKHGECMQHGQAKKRYEVGSRLPQTVLYYPVPRDVVTQLRPIPTGYQYVRVDNDVLLMQSATRQIIDAVVVLASLNK